MAGFIYDQMKETFHKRAERVREQERTQAPTE
jgi:hypothetical protein